MEAKKKAEITVGSVVRFVKAKNPAMERYIGETGIVVSVIRDVEFDIFREPELCHRNRLKIQMARKPESFWCDEDQVQLVTREKQKASEPSKPSPKRTIVIEITDDGANAKYVCGKEVRKTASIKRHPDDKPDDEVAASLVIAKLFGKNLRDLENAADKIIRNRKETLGWIHGAKEALDEAEKRANKLIF